MSYQSILTDIDTKTINFIKENYSEQIEALIQFYPIISSAVKAGIPKDSIKFGGGTALAMYYFQHRLSFDIDLFLLDQQYLSFFSPKLWIDDFSSFSNSEYTDKYNHIGVVTTTDIKLDILIDTNLTNKYIDDSKLIFPFDVYVETIEDIISKKIVFRKKDNKTRDIFHIAVAISKNEDLLSNLLTLNKIELQDLIDLNEALKKLNIDKYNSQIKIIEPIKEYEELSKNAPKILIEELKKIILK